VRQQLINYDDILDVAREKAEASRLQVNKYLPMRYIPMMYEALLRENPNFSPKDARDRIQKDCADIWHKTTILRALPDEAINQEEQKDDIINFEFSLSYGEIGGYLDRLYNEIGDAGDVRFSGRFDIRTGKVIEANVGRKRVEEKYGSLNDDNI
jgi:hypothetical protein